MILQTDLKEILTWFAMSQLKLTWSKDTTSFYSLLKNAYNNTLRMKFKAVKLSLQVPATGLLRLVTVREQLHVKLTNFW